jgi:hypothetical protein
MKPFNVNEYHSWLVNKKSPHHFVITAVVHGALSKIKLRRALDTVASQSSILNYSIASEHCGFIQTSQSIDIIWERGKKAWQRVVEQDLATPFQDDSCLVRLTVLESQPGIYHLLFCFHHIIGDGMSGARFMLDVLSVYNQKPPCAKSSGVVDTVDLFPEPAVKGEVLDYNGVTTRIETMTVKRKAVEVLLQRHAPGLRVGDYLRAIILKSMFKVFSIDSLKVNLPVNIRSDRTIAGAHDLSFLTSMVRLKLEQGLQSSLVDIHHSIKKQFTDRVKKNEHLKAMRDLADCINHRESDQAYVDQFASTEPTVFYSQLGNIDTPTVSEVEALHLVGCHVAVNCQTYMGTSDSLTIQVVELNRELISITFNYPSPLISQPAVQQLMQMVQQQFITDSSSVHA